MNTTTWQFLELDNGFGVFKYVNDDQPIPLGISVGGFYRALMGMAGNFLVNDFIDIAGIQEKLIYTQNGKKVSITITHSPTWIPNIKKMKDN